MNSSTISARRPDAWFPAGTPVSPIVNRSAAVIGKLLELGYNTLSRNLERDISNLQSLAQVRDVTSFIEHQQRCMREFWRDQERALTAATTIVTAAFDDAQTMGKAPEPIAPTVVDLPTTPSFKASKAGRMEPAVVSEASVSPVAHRVASVGAAFEIYRDKANAYRFQLKTSDGKVLLRSEGYRSRSSAVKGVASVKRNSNNDARYHRQASASGKSTFNLKAGNHQVIGSSSTFASSDEMEATIEIIRQTAGSAKVGDRIQAS